MGPASTFLCSVRSIRRRLVRPAAGGRQPEISDSLAASGFDLPRAMSCPRTESAGRLRNVGGVDETPSASPRQDFWNGRVTIGLDTAVARNVFAPNPGWCDHLPPVTRPPGASSAPRVSQRTTGGL